MTFTLPLLEWLDISAGRVALDGGGPVDVRPFRIARYPVTNAQFDVFIADGGYKDGAHWAELAQRMTSPRKSDWTEPDAPKLQACWYEAVAFTRWLSARTGLDVRLPTEPEWQWAAAGDTGFDYPYGPAFDPEACNVKESGIGRTNPVTAYARAPSPFGAVDMSGNVAEWCMSEGMAPENVQPLGTANRSVRGGSWSQPAERARATFRSHRSPMTRQFNIGFRVVAAL